MLKGYIVRERLGTPGLDHVSNSQAACGPVKSFVWSSLGFCSSNEQPMHWQPVLFDNLKFDVFDAGGPSATSSHLYCMMGDFHMSNDTYVQNLLIVL